MEALDLRLAPPRPPREELGGVIFLPRSIDKLRASLPGGHLGQYKLEGNTQLMLETFGTTVAHAIQIVAAASSDEEVAATLLRAAPDGAAASWNALISRREPSNGNRGAAIATYPWLAERPDLVLSLDVLAEDDRISFAS